MPKSKPLAKVKSLGELRQLAGEDPRYLQLAILGAQNLGAGKVDNLNQAMNWLNLNAMTGEGGDERGVVEEVNFCRDLVKV